MKVPVQLMTQEQFNQYLLRIVECAFREGMLYEKCGGENFMSLSEAIKSCQLNIVEEGNL